jgi:hypothetical protein
MSESLTYLLAKATYDLQGRVDSLELGQAWADNLLGPLAEAQRAERLRRGERDRAARYVRRARTGPGRTG